MKAWILAVLLSFSTATLGAPNCDPVDMEMMRKRMDRINRRYEDFFQYQHDKEAREARRRAGVEDIKTARQHREEQLERARKAYQAVPKDYAAEEARRLEWEERQKARVRKMEMNRLCEAQQRQQASELLSKGRRIPELKEFDLEE